MSSTTLYHEAEAISNGRTFYVNESQTIPSSITFKNKTGIAINGLGYIVTVSTPNAPVIAFNNCTNISVSDINLVRIDGVSKLVTDSESFSGDIDLPYTWASPSSLSKPHYFYSFSTEELTTANIPVWTRFAQITGTMSVGMWHTQSDFNYVCDILKAANKTNLGVFYEPMLHVWKGNHTNAYGYTSIPTAENLISHPDMVGASGEYYLLTRTFETRLNNWLRTYNATNGTSIQFSMCMLDTECLQTAYIDETGYHKRVEPELTNIKNCLDSFDTKIHECNSFETIPINWYGRRVRLDGDANDSNSIMKYWTGSEITSCITPIWYMVGDYNSVHMARFFQNITDNIALADSSSYSWTPPIPLHVWLALGSGYVGKVWGNPSSNGTYTDTWNYDAVKDYEIGVILASEPRVESVSFYPESYRYSTFSEHFEAYCSGFVHGTP